MDITKLMNPFSFNPSNTLWFEVTPHRSGEWKSPPIQGGASNHPQNHIHTLWCFPHGRTPG